MYKRQSERRGENPNGKIVLVVASKPGVYALERAANFGVESAVVSRKDYASGADFDAALLGVLQAHSIDAVSYTHLDVYKRQVLYRHTLFTLKLQRSVP